MTAVLVIAAAAIATTLIAYLFHLAGDHDDHLN